MTIDTDTIKKWAQIGWPVLLGIFTQNINRAMKAFSEMQVGGVQVNDIPTFRSDAMPYGGAKGSGLGREGPRYAIEEMSEMRLMVINKAGGVE